MVAGIWIDDSASSSVTTALGIEGGTVVTGGLTGLLDEWVRGRVCLTTRSTTPRLRGQTSNYISLSNSASASLAINGTGVSFDGLDRSHSDAGPRTMRSRTRSVHAIDVGTVGFVRVKAGNVFVTPNSFTPATLTPNIQRGVNAGHRLVTCCTRRPVCIRNIMSTINKPMTLGGRECRRHRLRQRAALNQSFARTATRLAVVTVYRRFERNH